MDQASPDAARASSRGPGAGRQGRPRLRQRGGRPAAAPWSGGLPLVDHQPLAGIAEFDPEPFAAHDDREAMAGIRVPGHRLAGLENEPADRQIVRDL